MPVFAVYIQKETQYGGSTVPFGNTYHFQVASLDLNNDAFVAQRVAELEQAVSELWVDFVGWTSWGPTDGTATANVMRGSGAFTFSGSIDSAAYTYREVCSLVVWPMPRHPVSNVRRWLRKFLRGAYGTNLTSIPVATGQEALPAANVEALESYALQVAAIDNAGTVNTLCGADGDSPNADPIARPYLITRQIGR